MNPLKGSEWREAPRRGRALEQPQRRRRLPFTHRGKRHGTDVVGNIAKWLTFIPKSCCLVPQRDRGFQRAGVGLRRRQKRSMMKLTDAKVPTRCDVGPGETLRGIHRGEPARPLSEPPHP